MRALVELSKIRYLLSLLNSWHGIMLFMSPLFRALFSLLSWAFWPQLLQLHIPNALSFRNYRSFISHFSFIRCLNLRGTLDTEDTFYSVHGYFLGRVFELGSFPRVGFFLNRGSCRGFISLCNREGLLRELKVFVSIVLEILRRDKG